MSGLIQAALIIFAAESRRRGATQVKRLKSQSSIAIRASCKMPRSSPSSLNAKYFGRCSTRFSMLMPKIADDARPRLAPGVRLQIDRTTGKNVLLFPEGIVELNETAQEILNRCDGRALSDIT